MVDLASPEARERIARVIYCKANNATEESWDRQINWRKEIYRSYADAALSEVAAMLEEDGDAH